MNTLAAPAFSIKFHKQGQGWLASSLAGCAARRDFPFAKRIEERAEQTQVLGSKPLWDGYGKKQNRTSDQVRTPSTYGQFYANLVETRQPKAIVEFGTAFGVSGMFWLAGLEMAGGGTLYTFEPNDIWSEIAEKNLAAISSRFVLTRGTFEDHAASVLTPGSVGVAFVDAIHTPEFVLAQYNILRNYMEPGGLILFDDIAFSPALSECWQGIAQGDDIEASASLGRRVGVIEMRS
jgi:predicted O-methyltransferase YrrM